MKKMSKKVLVLVLTAVLFISNLSFTVSAEDAKSTVQVFATGSYITSATVTKLPAPFANGSYKAFCADKNITINDGQVYLTNFHQSTDRKIAFLLNKVTGSSEAIQQVAWRILQGSYFEPSSAVKTEADTIYNTFFKYKNNNDFPSANSSTYNNTIFLADSGHHVQPIFIVAPNKFLVTFKYDGKQTTQYVDYGKSATAPTNTAKTGYNFSWDKSFSNVTSDLTVNGIYTIQNFNVAFIYGDSTSSQVVEYNQPATAPDATKTGYDYTWDKSFAHITSNLTVTAIYTIQKYNVAFVYGLDGTKSSQQVVNYNTSASAPNASETGHNYTWDKSFSNITENTTVNAIYTDIHFTVKFFDFDGTQIGETQDVIYGHPASDVTHPTKDGYEFIVWDTTFDSVKGNLEIHPNYSTYFTVTFVGFNNENLGSVHVTPAGIATAPELQPVAGHTFQGWDTELSPITENVTVTAIYTKNLYTVTFMDSDTTVWGTPQQVAFEEGAVAPEVNPSQVGKTFVAWNVTFNNITTDLTVSAVYTPNIYTVDFVDYNGLLLDSEQVQHGYAATAPTTNPVRIGYNFSGWNKEFSEITSNLTVTAIYARLPEEPTPTPTPVVEPVVEVVTTPPAVVVPEVVLIDMTVPEVVVPETIVPEAAPEVTASATTAAPVQEEVILDATVTPQGGLPNTGGLPIGLPVLAGSLTAAFGFIVRKLNNKDEE